METMRLSDQRAFAARALRALSRVLLLGLGLICALCGKDTAWAANEPLTLEFSIRLPDRTVPNGFKLVTSPGEFQWSPDSRQLAIYGSGAGKVFLLDIAQKKVVDNGILFNAGSPNIAWSPDSSLIAVASLHVGLFRVADGKELARREKLRYQCSGNPRQAVAFTADGHFLWVGCGANAPGGKRAPYVAAEKLGVPDLETAKRVETDGIEPGKQNFSDSDRIVTDGGRLLLTSLLNSCEPKTDPTELGMRCRRYATCIDLEAAKKPCFAGVFLDTSPTTPYPNDLQLIPGKAEFVAFWHWRRDFTLGADPAFKMFNFSGRLIREFGFRDEFETVPPRHFAVARGGLVIGTACKIEDGFCKDGRLMVWNAETGQLLQRTILVGADLLALSPDGRRVAVKGGLEIKVYSIAQTQRP
jgi:hypothetical protein